MTDVDWYELILFKLISYDLTDMKYVGVDFDGEIVVGDDKMALTDNTIPPSGYEVWEVHKNGGFDNEATRTGIFLRPAPPNYKELMFKL